MHLSAAEWARDVVHYGTPPGPRLDVLRYLDQHGCPRSEVDEVALLRKFIANGWIRKPHSD